MHPTLLQVLEANGGVLDSRRHRALRHRLSSAVARGELVRVLPTIYAPSEEAATLSTRARAACAAATDAVVTGLAAAILGGWDDLAEPREVEVASLTLRRPRAGFQLRRRAIPRSLTRVVAGIRITTFPLTALDLALAFGDAWLDDALRRGVEPSRIKLALAGVAGRRGTAHLRDVVESLRDKPWSPLERRAHDLLRGASITGWVANRALYGDSREDRIGYGDLVFADVRLIIELDGAHHDEPGQRARDEARDLRLARRGWEVIRFRGHVVTRTPTVFVQAVQDILATRRASRGPV